MSDLTDFLLARIAEDEAYAEAVEDGMYALEDDYPPSLSALKSLARFKAEREATRRLVARFPVGGNSYGIEVQRTLAAVYADHPDYRQEWRP